MRQHEAIAMDNRPFYYRLRGRMLGPVGIRQMRQLAQRAQIGQTTDVSRDGQQWGKAADFPEIFDAAGAEPPRQTRSSGREEVSFDFETGDGAGPPSPGMGGQRWYYTINGTQQGPIDLGTLQQLVASGRISANEHAIPEGGAQWMPLHTLPQLTVSWGPTMIQAAPVFSSGLCTVCGAQHPASVPFCPQCGAPTVTGSRRSYDQEPVGERKSRIVTALLAFFLGYLGIHRFYIGDTGLGVLYLLTFGCCLIGATIDFIIFLTMSDRDFDAKYNRRRRR